MSSFPPDSTIVSYVEFSLESTGRRADLPTLPFRFPQSLIIIASAAGPGAAACLPRGTGAYNMGGLKETQGF